MQNGTNFTDIARHLQKALGSCYDARNIAYRGGKFETDEDRCIFDGIVDIQDKLQSLITKVTKGTV